jgi:hypothetical protein
MNKGEVHAPALCYRNRRRPVFVARPADLPALELCNGWWILPGNRARFSSRSPSTGMAEPTQDVWNLLTGSDEWVVNNFQSAKSFALQLL